MASWRCRAAWGKQAELSPAEHFPEAGGEAGTWGDYETTFLSLLPPQNPGGAGRRLPAPASTPTGSTLFNCFLPALGRAAVALDYLI